MSTASPASSDTLAFDLSDLVGQWKASHRAKRVITTWTLSVLGLFFVGLGVLVVVVRHTNPSWETYLAGSLLALTGCLLCLATRVAPTARRIPTRLELSASGFSLVLESGENSITRAWDDKNVKIQLRDLRELQRSGASRPGRPPLWLMPSIGLWVPVPPNAYDAMISRAREHHLRVETSPGIPGELLVTITSPKGA